jgi:hypothetical protein
MSIPSELINDDQDTIGIGRLRQSINKVHSNGFPIFEGPGKGCNSYLMFIGCAPDTRGIECSCALLGGSSDGS